MSGQDFSCSILVADHKLPALPFAVGYGLFALWHVYRYERLYDEANGKLKPEVWLEVGIVGAWFIPICMWVRLEHQGSRSADADVSICRFFFGWTANASIHWIVPIIASGFFSIGTFALVSTFAELLLIFLPY